MQAFLLIFLPYNTIPKEKETNVTSFLTEIIQMMSVSASTYFHIGSIESVPNEPLAFCDLLFNVTLTGAGLL